MKRLFFRNQSGDTIVEVLVAIAVVSLVLAGAYASTNRNVRTTQDTQEHSEALQLVQSQLEFLRSKGQPSGTCFTKTGTAGTGAACQLGSDGNTYAGKGPDFALSIASPGSCSAPVKTYEVKATWPSLVDSATNNISMCYRPPTS